MVPASRPGPRRARHARSRAARTSSPGTAPPHERRRALRNPPRRAAPGEQNVALIRLASGPLMSGVAQDNRSKPTRSGPVPGPLLLPHLPSSRLLFYFRPSLPSHMVPPLPAPAVPRPSTTRPQALSYQRRSLPLSFRSFLPRSPSPLPIGRAHRSLVAQSASWASGDGRGRSAGAFRSRLPPPFSRLHIPPPLPPPGPAVVFAGTAVALGLGRGGRAGRRGEGRGGGWGE